MPLKIAKVKDNNSENSPDKKQNGRIKVFVYGVHSPTEEDTNLPWAMCAQQDLEIPEVNDLVVVDYLDESNYKHLVYKGRIELPNLTDFDKFDENVKPNVSGFTGSYPNVKYKYYNNGACMAIASDTGEFLYYKDSNTYFYVSNSGEIISKAGSAGIEPAVLGDTLMGLLESILDQIVALTVISSAPTVASSVPVNASAFTAIKEQLSTILSAKVKHN